jgi:hypothetical protein
MKEIYELSLREMQFLKALKEKVYNPNQWTTYKEDEEFRKQWGVEYGTFNTEGFFSWRRFGENFVWSLTDKGLKLQEKTLEDLRKLESKKAEYKISALKSYLWCQAMALVGR